MSDKEKTEKTLFAQIYNGFSGYSPGGHCSVDFEGKTVYWIPRSALTTLELRALADNFVTRTDLIGVDRAEISDK